jgi:biotin carboxyl carrier protein
MMTRAPLLLLALLACPLSFPLVALAHGGEDHSHDAPSPLPADASAPRRLADGSLFVPKTAQRQMGLRTLPAASAPLAARLEFPGRVIADPAASGRVQAPLAGRIEPGPQGLPVLGQRVAKGQILAWLRPITGGIERGAQQAQLAELEAQLALGERKLARYTQLDGAIPAKEVEAARIEQEALRQRKAALAGGLRHVEALTAPVSGVVSEARITAGQVVEAREPLMEIVDPARLAVEALAYYPAQGAGLAQARLALPEGELPLQFVGAGRHLREQALPLLFRLRPGASTAALAVGLPVKVLADARATRRGVALPLTALQRGAAGETLVWIKQAPERYAPRRVETQALDTQRVAVVAGLEDGERVVTTGAGLLGQVR